MPATPVQKTGRQRLLSAVSATVLLVAVAVGALLLWQSSAGTARAALTPASIGFIGNANTLNLLNNRVALAPLSPTAAIQAVIPQKNAEASPPVPSGNRPTRSRFK